MNDLEINKAVSKKLGHTYDDECDDASIWVEVPSLFQEGQTQLVIVDYCNNWQDAGPIIEKYKLELCRRTLENGETGWGASYNFGDFVNDESALKAAMLCFLEMEI